jgi:hypothetical protein
MPTASKLTTPNGSITMPKDGKIRSTHCQARNKLTQKRSRQNWRGLFLKIQHAMNIFVLHKNPTKAASWLCDQHINKMIVESAQMIANCFSLETLEQAPKTQKGTSRKHSYYNHPCSIWARETRKNLEWLARHALAMEGERIARGYNPHFCVEFLVWALWNIHKSENPEGKLTKFAIAISEDSNCRKIEGFDDINRVEQYRLYYKHDKPFATWKRNKPAWID